MSKKIKVQPIGSKILVEPKKVEEKTKGGLIVPPSASEEQKPEMGVVVKLGTGETEKGEKIKFCVKEGETVYFKKYSLDEIEVEGEKYFIIDNMDILAVI